MFIQQGDVLLHKLDDFKADPNAKQVAPKNGKLVLAEGEATGHAHPITLDNESDVKLYTIGEILTLTVESTAGTELDHQEHSTVNIPAGSYRVGAVQEYDYIEQEARSVRD